MRKANRPSLRCTFLISVAILSGCSASRSHHVVEARSCGSLNSAKIIWPVASVCAAAEYPWSASKKLEIAKGVWIDVGFEITSKGNGAVCFPGLCVRVYDSHDDGLVFCDRLLRCEWLDDDGDGLLDFVASGIAVRTNQKTGAEQGSMAVRGVFRYNANQRRFEPVICSPEISFWKT